jgi:4-oxalocrotonate tautomerase
VPHVVVKLWPGKTRAQKQELTDAIVVGVTRILNYGDDAVSVGFEEVPPADWTARVVEPDIKNKWNTLTKRPGYVPGPSAPDARASS